MVMMNIILSTLFAFGVTITILPTLISFLINKKIGDRIDERRMHTAFIPTAGGLGVYVAFLITLFLFSFFFGEKDLLPIAILISIVFLAGLLDDLFNLTVVIKFLAMIFASIAVMTLTDVKISSLYGLFGIGELGGFLSYLLTILVIVFLTNAFNLIDGVDGLLSVIASFTLMVFGVWFLLIGEFSYALISLALLGSIAGFLVYNWFPAKIFMGDTGSLTIGFIIAFLSIAFLNTNGNLPIDSVYKINAPISLAISLLIFPIFDTFRVFILRILNKQSPFKADKRHVHHYLFSLNFGVRKIVIVLLSFNVLSFFAVIFSKGVSDSLLFIFLFGFLIFCSFAMRWYKNSRRLNLRKKVFYKQSA